MEKDGWKNCHIQAFWRDIASWDHLVQVYENEKIFLDTLEGFAGTGLIHDESVIIIARKKTIEALNNRLITQHFDITELERSNKYLTFDAEEVLNQFMDGNWPNENKFHVLFHDILAKARGEENRKVRAFGDMVAVLWERKLAVATMYLEGLWEQLREIENFTLFCAYPKSCFSNENLHGIESICRSHSKVIDGKWHPTTEVHFRNVV